MRALIGICWYFWQLARRKEAISASAALVLMFIYINTASAVKRRELVGSPCGSKIDLSSAEFLM